ncbi:Macrophage migration inhibitory factor-like [Octopus vulgaris]|uniref:Macrophage migration inhibitory factor-like n=1 Tax=Octopus vulgaris TaxID=6645 RepID=A0AA36BCY8_OCTVU|nr:Macrophage migration inhibitory factor-like [Octopus vulgaris]
MLISTYLIIYEEHLNTGYVGLLKNCGDFWTPLKMVLILQERIFIVENVFRDGGKYTKEVQESFQEKFGAERLPHRNCVSALLHKFKKTGSVQDKPKSGRPKVVTDTVLQNVTNKLQRSPRKSLRRLSQETRISLTSTHRAVHQLKFFPYKVHVVHELKPQDSEKRVLFCRRFENFILEKGWLCHYQCQVLFFGATCNTVAAIKVASAATNGGKEFEVVG